MQTCQRECTASRNKKTNAKPAVSSPALVQKANSPVVADLLHFTAQSHSFTVGFSIYSPVLRCCLRCLWVMCCCVYPSIDLQSLHPPTHSCFQWTRAFRDAPVSLRAAERWRRTQLNHQFIAAPTTETNSHPWEHSHPVEKLSGVPNWGPGIWECWPPKHQVSPWKIIPSAVRSHGSVLWNRFIFWSMAKQQNVCRRCCWCCRQCDCEFLIHDTSSQQSTMRVKDGTSAPLKHCFSLLTAGYWTLWAPAGGH